MRYLILILLVSGSCFAQHKTVKDTTFKGLMYQAGKKGQSGVSLIFVGAAVSGLGSLIAINENEPNTARVTSIVGGVLMFTGILFEASAWKQISIASEKLTYTGTGVKYSF